MYNFGLSSRKNRSLSWTEKPTTPLPPREVMIPNRNSSPAALRSSSFNNYDNSTRDNRRTSRSRSNSVDVLLNLSEEPTATKGTHRRRTSERSKDRLSNKSGESSNRNIRNYHSSPDLSLYEELELQQSSTSLDAAVELAASRLGVAVPHSNHYCYRTSNPPNESNARNSSSRIRREQRLREREVSRQQSLPIARSSTRMEPSSETSTRAYAPSIQCNPVSPMVLQHLPTIVVRYEDLYPEDFATSNLTSPLDCSMDTLSLEDNGYASSGSLSIGLDALTTYSCTICCEDIEIGSTAVRLPCAHLYHANCIVTWLSKFNTCPICRFTLPTLADFTTATVVTKHFQSSRNEQATLRPMLFTRKELNELSSEQLQSLYKSWVICTYTTESSGRKLPIEVPATACADQRVLIDYLVECQVISLIPTGDAPTTKPKKSKADDLRAMSIRDLKALVPPSAATIHVVEKQELIEIILEQFDSPDVGKLE